MKKPRYKTVVSKESDYKFWGAIGEHDIWENGWYIRVVIGDRRSFGFEKNLYSAYHYVSLGKLGQEAFVTFQKYLNFLKDPSISPNSK